MSKRVDPEDGNPYPLQTVPTLQQNEAMNERMSSVTPAGSTDINNSAKRTKHCDPVLALTLASAIAKSQGT